MILPAAFSAPPATTAPATPPVPHLRDAIRDVADAPDIDAAMDAYARGMRIDANSVALYKAYVQRMVDLEVPQLGASAADRVLAVEPNNALARAVTAYAEARQDQMPDALTDIALAAKRAPEDKFVARTAGHLFAWYDHNPNPPYLPANVRLAIQEAHAALSQSSTFNAAFDDATSFYRQQHDAIARDGADGGQVAGPTTAPAASQAATAPGGAGETPDYAGYSGSGIGYSAGPSYVPEDEPYAYTSYGYGTLYDPGYSYYCAPYNCLSPFWCWGPTFVYVIECHDHHHHNDGQDHHHDGIAEDPHQHHGGGSGSVGGVGTGHGGAGAVANGRDHELNGRFRDRFFGGGSIDGGGHGALAGGALAGGAARFGRAGGRHGNMVGSGAINIGSEPLVPPVADGSGAVARRGEFRGRSARAVDGDGAIIIHGRGGYADGMPARGGGFVPARGASPGPAPGGGAAIGGGPRASAPPPSRGGGGGEGDGGGGGARYGGASMHSGSGGVHR